MRTNSLSQTAQSFASHSQEAHKTSLTNHTSNNYISPINNTNSNNSIHDEEILPEPGPNESRGTPDGCGLESPAELLNKKGWLMKQGLTKEWHKYWFVLQDVALLYYRDPKAESKGFLDGIIDLSQVQRIDKQELPRHFGFHIKTYEGKTTVFSAITDGIRKNWIASLQKAANVSPNSAGNDNDSDSNSTSFGNMRKRSSVNEMDVITTTRIVRASTTTPPSLTKVPSLPAPLTLQTSTTTMTYSTEVFDDEEDETTDEDDEEDYDSEDCDDESEDEVDGQCMLENKENVKVDHNDLLASKEGNPLKSSGLDEICTTKNHKNADGVLVDLLETEVDSLKAQLERTQSELYSLHHSNISRGHSASSSSHSSLQSMTQQQQYIVPPSNNSSLSSSANNNNNLQQVQTTSQQTIQQQQTLPVKRYNNDNSSVPSSASSHQHVSANQQQSTFQTGMNEVNNSSFSSSLHQKAQQHKQQLQQQKQLVDQLSKEHTETLSQLNKAKSTIAKHTVEISSLKAQISK